MCRHGTGRGTKRLLGSGVLGCPDLQEQRLQPPLYESARGLLSIGKALGAEETKWHRKGGEAWNREAPIGPLFGKEQVGGPLMRTMDRDMYWGQNVEEWNTSQGRFVLSEIGSPTDSNASNKCYCLNGCKATLNAKC